MRVDALERAIAIVEARMRGGSLVVEAPYAPPGHHSDDKAGAP